MNIDKNLTNLLINLLTKNSHKKLDLFKICARARLLPRNISRILIKEKGRLLVLFIKVCYFSPTEFI